MSANNPQKQGRILEGGGNFSGWPEYIPLKGTLAFLRVGFFIEWLKPYGTNNATLPHFGQQSRIRTCITESESKQHNIEETPNYKMVRAVQQGTHSSAGNRHFNGVQHRRQFLCW